jgi:hypothetical protein
MGYVLFYTRLVKILPDGYHLLSGYNVTTNSFFVISFCKDMTRSSFSPLT